MKAALLAGALLAQFNTQQPVRPPTPPPNPPGTRAVWKVDWTNERCVLTLEPGQANQVGLSLRLIPGATRPQLIVFVNTAEKKLDVPKPTKAVVELAPGAFKGDTVVGPQMVAGGKALILAFEGLDQRFLDGFARSDKLSFTIGGETVEVPMKLADKARQALQTCVDETLTELGLDPKAVATLREPPRGDWQKFATMTNYPAAAMRARKSGMVVFRAIVDADGQAGKCDILQSSGTKELDDQTCELIRSRVRFKPAVAADGSKAVAPIVDAMNWQFGVAGRR